MTNLQLSCAAYTRLGDGGRGADIMAWIHTKYPDLIATINQHYGSITSLRTFYDIYDVLFIEVFVVYIYN
jgi:hypothetical protein